MNQFEEVLEETIRIVADGFLTDVYLSKEDAIEDIIKAHNADIVAVLEGLKEASLFKPKWVHIDDINEAIKKHGV